MNKAITQRIEEIMVAVFVMIGILLIGHNPLTSRVASGAWSR